MERYGVIRPSLGAAKQKLFLFGVAYFVAAAIADVTEEVRLHAVCSGMCGGGLGGKYCMPTHHRNEFLPTPALSMLTCTYKYI